MDGFFHEKCHLKKNGVAILETSLHGTKAFLRSSQIECCLDLPTAALCVSPSSDVLTAQVLEGSVACTGGFGRRILTRQ